MGQTALPACAECAILCARLACAQRTRGNGRLFTARTRVPREDKNIACMVAGRWRLV